VSLDEDVNELSSAFLLGIGAGGGCLAHCGPAVAPIALCGGARRLRLAGAFFAARLCGYALVAAAVILAQAALGATVRINPVIEGAVMIVLALVLVRYGLNLRKAECGVCDREKGREAFDEFRKHRLTFAAQSGFLTGLGTCAPLLTLVLSGLVSGSAWGAATSFIGFFAGTTAILLPLFLFGYAAGNRPIVQKIGLMCAFAAAGLYFLQGLLTIVTAEV
jgi:sulfite exporter TauE/SafE